VAKRKANEPKTAFGRYMVYTFIPSYANNVNGVVYMGAAILIIIVGLRGLGKVAGQLSVIPRVMLTEKGSLDPNWVVGAILLEFTLLMLLAVVTFFTPEGDSHAKPKEETSAAPRPDFQKDIRELKDLTDEEIKMVNEYLDKFEAISKRINDIQMNNVKALSSLKEVVKS
jgi:hypothetical protein